MSEFEELLQSFGDEAEGMTEEELGASAEKSASEAINESFEKDFGKDLDDVADPEEAEVNEGAKEGRKAVAELKDIDPAETVDKWQSPKAWGKWVAIEIGKGILFAVGAKAVEEVWKKIKETTPSKDNEELYRLSLVSSEAIGNLKAILAEWHQWLNDHYSSRDKYGSVDVEETTILRFEIFQVKVTAVDTYRNGEMVKVATEAKKSPTKATLIALLKSELKYADMMAKVAKDISEKEAKMVQDGLKDHTDEIKAVFDSLTKATS